MITDNAANTAAPAILIARLSKCVIDPSVEGRLSKPNYLRVAT